ncbi:hypothetical protein [Lacibacter sp. H407]
MRPKSTFRNSLLAASALYAMFFLSAQYFFTITIQNNNLYNRHYSLQYKG